MNVDEFLRLVASEPNRTTRRVVEHRDMKIVEEAMKNGGGYMLTDFLKLPVLRREGREFHDGHVLGPGASLEKISAWENAHPTLPLPDDLRAFLQRIDGIHLWADLETGRGYDGIAPIEDWELARTRMWGTDVDPTRLSDGHVAISYNADDSVFVVLNTTTGIYYWMDPGGADESCQLATDVESLLDWVWENRIPPDEGLEENRDDVR